jgi:hypothetical protein
MAPTFATDDASDVHDVLLPGAHAPAVDRIVCRSILRDHPGCVSYEGGAMQRVPEAGAGSLEGWDVVEVNTWGKFRLPRSCEGIGVYLMPGFDEVPSQLHLLPRQAAGEVEVAVDECDSQGSALGTGQPRAVVARMPQDHPSRRWQVGIDGGHTIEGGIESRRRRPQSAGDDWPSHLPYPEPCPKARRSR